ncbi:succinate dehydrogenase [Nitratireductor sp. CH_MIT9313-5]|uniref:succinate dehydrogenase n=1 Tax=Nitratireductor sp. CH_MIT9313-5 TaxID=3107764 RepID=UPI0030081FB6
MLDLRLYLAQRISAMIMVPFVITHLAVMIYAIQGGLSAAEILARTQGSLFWFLFYGMFVAAVSVHAAIGVRVVLSEVAGLRGLALTLVATAAFFLFLLLGASAVIAVTVAP